MEYQTMGFMGIIYSPTHDTQQMRPLKCTNYPAEAFSSYAGSGDGYYNY